MNLTASGSALCSTCFVSGSQNIFAPSQFRYLGLSAQAERLGAAFTNVQNFNNSPAQRYRGALS